MRKTHYHKQHPERIYIMVVNGTEISVGGLGPRKIGELLRQSSPRKDGAGLRVVLTQGEMLRLTRPMGLGIRVTLSNLIALAVIAAGQHSNFEDDYDGIVFTTKQI